MKRRTTISATLLLACVLSACGDSPSAPAVEPGQLSLHFTSPQGAEGALLLQITSPAPISTLTPVDARTVVLARQVGGSTRAMVLGNLPPGELLRFAVPDVNQLGSYAVTLSEVADARNALRSDLSGYRAELRVVR